MTPDLDLSLANIWWTVPFLVGTVCALVHSVWTWQRWRATVIMARPRVERAAAFWFFRQDVLSAITGGAMVAAGVLDIVDRFPDDWALWCALTGAVAFAANKAWNLLDDARVLFLIRLGALRRKERSA